jgi:drug/metabolite transporter (DMT)-like permease
MTPSPPTASPQSDPTSRGARWALPALLLGVIALGFSPIFVRLSEVGPIATAVNRLVLPLPLFWALLWARPDERVTTGWRDIGILALGGVFFAGDLAVWHWSLKLTTVANSTFLANLSSMLVVLFAWLLFRERVSRLFLYGLATALTGAALLMSRSFEISATTLAGDGCALIAAGFYAGYLLSVARVRQRVPALATIAVGGLAASLILLPLALLTEGQIWPVTFNGWMAALALAVVSQSIGQMLLIYAMGHVPAGLGAMALLMQPVIAGVLAWILFGESLGPLQMVGAAAILVGIEVSRRGAAG